MRRFPGDRGQPREMGGGRAPRPPRGPEHNLIQRPDITSALVERFGLRQAHIAPTLTEGVQPVVLVEDLTGGSVRGETTFFGFAQTGYTSAILNGIAGVYMPTTATVAARMKRARVSLDDQGGLSGQPVGGLLVRNTEGTTFGAGAAPNNATADTLGHRLNTLALQGAQLHVCGGTNNGAFFTVNNQQMGRLDSMSCAPITDFDLEGLVLGPGDYFFIVVNNGGVEQASVTYQWSEIVF